MKTFLLVVAAGALLALTSCSHRLQIESDAAWHGEIGPEGGDPTTYARLAQRGTRTFEIKGGTCWHFTIDGDQPAAAHLHVINKRGASGPEPTVNGPGGGVQGCSW